MQWSAILAHNQEVSGSNPLPATKRINPENRINVCVQVNLLLVISILCRMIRGRRGGDFYTQLTIQKLGIWSFQVELLF